jgi:hypothetical protein
MKNLTPVTLLALIAIVPFAVWAVNTKRAQTAALTVIFVTILFGPEEAVFKFPGIPPLGKHSIPYLVLFLLGFVRWGQQYRKARLGAGLERLLLIAIPAGYVTWQTNTDALTFGEFRVTHLPALIINDASMYGLGQILAYGIPFMLGRVLFRERRDLLELLHFFAASALVQGLIVLWEGRFSPQLHNMLYGYHAHPDFLQSMRWGGFRPSGFTAHGLSLALYMALSFFAAVILSKLGRPIRWVGTKWTPRVLGLLVLACRSTGALTYAITIGPLLAFAKPKAHVTLAMAIALFVGIYPALRAFDLFPTKGVTETAVSLFGESRADSLKFRFDNEELLLDHARERLWFGWGGQGRNLTYDDYLGSVMTVADGQWIIVFGMHGVVGMVVAFGFLLIPILRARRHFKLLQNPKDQRLLAGIALMTAMAVLDLIPNGLFATYPYFLAGALAGSVEELRNRRSSWHLAPKPSTAKPSRVAVSVQSPGGQGPSMPPGPRFSAS